MPRSVVPLTGGDYGAISVALKAYRVKYPCTLASLVLLLSTLIASWQGFLIEHLNVTASHVLKNGYGAHHSGDVSHGVAADMLLCGGVLQQSIQIWDSWPKPICPLPGAEENPRRTCSGCLELSHSVFL